MANRRRPIAAALAGAASLAAPAAAHLRARDLVQECPAPYDRSKRYGAGATASLSGTVYRCRSGPAAAYCDLFPPNYEHESGGDVVHAIGEELGWADCGPCARWRATDGASCGARVRRRRRPKGAEARERKRAKARARARAKRAEKGDGGTPRLPAIAPRSSGGGAIPASNDAYVNRRRPGETFDRPTLRFDGHKKVALLRFALPEAAYKTVLGGGAAATLSVFSLQGCDGAMRAEVVSGDFDEGAVTWRDAPFAPGPPSAQPPEAARNMRRDAWYELDVSNAVLWSASVMDQLHVTFRIALSDGDGGECALASKEYRAGEFAPSLSVREAGGSMLEMQWTGNTNNRNPNPVHEWYVRYDLGPEGQCVMSCRQDQGEHCGGPAAFWEDIYASPKECCEDKLWWIVPRVCVPGHQF